MHKNIYKCHIYSSYSQNADSLLIFKCMIYSCKTAGAFQAAVNINEKLSHLKEAVRVCESRHK